MSNPTTPFSWQMPTSTDLVTDLPADFEVFGQAVATDLADLLGGPSGYILSKASATDMDFTWIANDQGDITGVTAGTGITVTNPTGPVPTVTNDMATTITAAGDIVVGTGSGTYDNLPIGTTEQVLTADTTVSPYKVKWATPAAVGMTVLSSGSLSSTTFTISGISGAYIDLQLVIRNFKTGTDGATLKLRFNGDTNTRYKRQLTYGNSGALAFNETEIQFVAGNSNVNANGLSVIEIPDYANATTWQTCNWVSASDQDGVGGGMQNNIGYGTYNQLDAITSITLFPSAGTMTGTYTLYGVK